MRLANTGNSRTSIRSRFVIRLILASCSTYRLELLRQAGYAVTAMASEIVEPHPTSFSDPEMALLHIAELKARAVGRKLVHQNQEDSLILAADTVGLAGGQIFGKPKGRADARRMLMAISGTVHEVLTGWCLLRTHDQLFVGGIERTRITMRDWTELELEDYLDSGEWEGKCGAYGLRIEGDPFVTNIEGSTSNVIGVPLERLSQVLAEFPGLTLNAVHVTKS